MEQLDQIFLVPINGELNLHTLQPAYCRNLVTDYLAACREKGILQVRIIHGRGRGVLRQTMYRVLPHLPEVTDFYHSVDDDGGWGATIVIFQALHP